MPAEPTENQNTYFIDAESAAEMGRLMRLDEVMTECMGGFFAEHPNLSGVHRTLDVGCGPGAWASEMAYHYPQMEVTGIDISNIMIEYAQAQARVQHLENIDFQVMDATKPLDFPDNTFDLVNARLIVGFMSRQTWHGTLRELVRVTRPGGIVRLTETDSMGLSNSFALEKLNCFFTRSLYVTGQSFAPYEGSQHFCMTPMLEPLLRDAGCVDIHRQPYMLDYSAGARAHLSFYENHKVAFNLLQPFFIKTGVSTQEELDTLYEQMLAEMMSDQFRALAYILSVWGYKPA
jgi:ubiquinone/menaquinone biosynthesis C-methylase UbiE